MICKYYGKQASLEYFRTLCQTGRGGSSLLAISEAAEQTGFSCMGARIPMEELRAAEPFPCIAFWNSRHYIVVYRISRTKVYVADPAHGLVSYTHPEFLKGWGGDEGKGIVLTLEPTAAFQTADAEQEDTVPESGFRHILFTLLRYRRLLWQLLAGLTMGSLLQLLFPFLTQSMVDTGIAGKDLSFIYVVLLSQLAVFLGRTSMEIMRSYILLHLGSRINIQLLTGFFSKLMRLPLGYFDSRMIGDILQRINDHKRVENFFTSSALSTAFSLLNLLVFTCILAWYNRLIVLVFLAGSLLYVVWIMAFMKKRAALDYKLFSQMAANQEKDYEMITGMQEIKLHNAERKKRWQWQLLQVRLFRINIRTLSLKQLQSGGAMIINELKNILITFLAAQAVVKGQLSLGVMLSVSYITGQLNGPLLQMIEFMQALQDARLSMNRINEIHHKREEESGWTEQADIVPQGDIVVSRLSFRYLSGTLVPDVLDNISLVIPRGKVTAIVGSSGSGKTTLLKLLLKFYDPSAGSINVGAASLSAISARAWRDRCGVVMQDGFIFNDTIANNIAVGDERTDPHRLRQAAATANIHDFITGLPLGYQTKIGANGMGISSGQKQRLLIARAVYKDPDFLFFDEATSALDAQNERSITDNLQKVFAGKTVVIIAHRLSTVRNADKIVVLDKGSISEAGRHDQLITEKGFYYQLVRNQLELGS
jgi:ATP-binding cassette subfamily B protein